jgi:hypothetical protein
MIEPYNKPLSFLVRILKLIKEPLFVPSSKDSFEIRLKKLFKNNL